MGLAVFYDPCFNCEHKETKKMCNMCILTYLRNVYKEDFVKPESVNKTLEELTGKYDIEKLNNYIDDTFERISKKLEEKYE